MRLFTALDLPGDVIRNLSQMVERLRPTARIQWSPPENFHITTKFIGEWPEERLAELKQALAGIESRVPIPVHIHEAGFFPNPYSARVFWCGIEAPGLDSLAIATDRATASLAIPRESRAFSAHLTLARIKQRINLQPLRDAIAALPTLDFGRFEVDRFFLYQSKPTPSGSVYSKLAEYSFSQK